MTTDKKIHAAAAAAAKKLLEVCINEKVENPLIEMDIDFKDSPEKYRLRFERVDLDDTTKALP
jgi:hypothetical protein